MSRHITLVGQSTPDTNNCVHQVNSFNNSLLVALSTGDTNMCQVQGFNKTLLVALSTADTNKWATLLNRGDATPESQVASFDYERTGPIRQRQRRLSEAQAHLMSNKYQSGATVYELAQEFGISRHTVSGRLKKVGVRMRLQSPGSELVNAMVEMYRSGLSLVEVGNRVGTSAGTVYRYLRISGIQMRDSHGRDL